MAEQGDISIGEYTKLRLFDELKDCGIITTRLETECEKRESVGQNKNVNCTQKRISCSYSTEELAEIIRKDQSVLHEVKVQYQQLYQLKGCDQKLSADNGPANQSANSQSSDCDCGKVDAIKDTLLKLLKDNLDLCGSLKEKVKIFRVTTEYYPDQIVFPGGREVVTPKTITKLVLDICAEMDQILMYCKRLWDDVDRFAGRLRDSGIETTLESFDSLALQSNTSDDLNNWNQRESQRLPHEHTDDQTDVKESL